MDKLNILHWILFYNKHKILNYILKNYGGDNFLIGRIFTGDHIPFNYEYKNVLGEKKLIQVRKLGLIICLL